VLALPLLLALLLCFAAPALAQVPADAPAPYPPGEPFAAAVPQDTLGLLTVAEATALVLAENPRVAIARLDALIAQNDASLGNAGFLPTLSLDATQRRVPTRPDLSFRTDNVLLDASANARVTVFEGLARVSRYRRLQTLARVEALSAEALAEDLLADALVTYYDVAAQQQQLVVLREAAALSAERLRIAEGRRDVGAASELEVRRAAVDLNADRAALLRQQTALARSRAALNQLLGRTTGLDYRVADAVAVDTSLALGPLEAAALGAAPDLQAARIAEEAAELEVQALRREFWPRLDLTAGYVFSEFTDPLLPPAQAGGFSYGLAATFVLFDGANRQRRVQNARLRRMQQAEAAEQARTATLTALRSTYALYTQSLALVALEAENAAVAEQNAAVALERFRLGVSTSLELREVQRALVSARSQLVAARFEAKVAEVDLLALAGLLLPE
jgi:outer membrane protein TolC